MALADLRLETFTPHVGDVFVADFGDQGTVDLELVVAYEQPTANDDVEVFALEFRGPLDRVFDQAIVPLLHDRLGALELFLVPVEEGAEGRTYEAVFTRLLDRES